MAASSSYAAFGGAGQPAGAHAETLSLNQLAAAPCTRITIPRGFIGMLGPDSWRYVCTPCDMRIVLEVCGRFGVSPDYVLDQMPAEQYKQYAGGFAGGAKWALDTLRSTDIVSFMAPRMRSAIDSVVGRVVSIYNGAGPNPHLTPVDAYRHICNQVNQFLIDSSPTSSSTIQPPADGETANKYKKEEVKSFSNTFLQLVGLTYCAADIASGSRLRIKSQYEYLWYCLNIFSDILVQGLWWETSSQQHVVIFTIDFQHVATATAEAAAAAATADTRSDGQLQIDQ